MSHIREQRLNYLAKKNLPIGLNDTKLDMYNNFLVGKQKRISFKHHSSCKKEDALELVHPDICGSLNLKSIGSALVHSTLLPLLIIILESFGLELWKKGSTIGYA